MSDKPYMDRCIELEKRIEVLEARNQKLHAALAMAKLCVPAGMKPEHQQIDDALKS